MLSKLLFFCIVPISKQEIEVFLHLVMKLFDDTSAERISSNSIKTAQKSFKKLLQMRFKKTF